jgi:hypothetical protein
VTGDTVGNPAATKTGDTVTCHRAAISRREALPGAWEAGVYLTAGAEANHQSLHGQYVGTPSRKRRRHRRWLGSRDDDRLPRITGPCDRAPAARDHQLALVTSRGGLFRHCLSFIMIMDGRSTQPHASNSHTCKRLNRVDDKKNCIIVRPVLTPYKLFYFFYFFRQNCRMYLLYLRAIIWVNWRWRNKFRNM